MASSKEYLTFILEQLSDLEGISYRAMMGEYIIYYREKIVGGIYDDRLLVKPVKSAVSLMPNAIYELPYDGAKEMLLVDNVDNKDFLTRLFVAMYDELPAQKRRSHKIGTKEEFTALPNFKKIRAFFTWAGVVSIVSGIFVLSSIGHISQSILQNGGSLDGLFQMGAVKLNLLFMVVSIVLGILLIKKKTTTMAYILAIIELIYVLLAITSGGSVGIGAISFLLSLVGAIRIDKKWKLYQEISVGNNQGNPAGNSTDGRTQNNAYAQYHTSQAANNETYWQKKPEENHGFVSTGASKSLKEALNIYKKEKSWSAENDMIESLKTSKVWVPYISEKNQLDILKNGERYYFPVFTSAAEMKEYGKKFYQREVYISDAINMAKESRYVLTGLVINAFTDSVILNWDQLGTGIPNADEEEKTTYKR